MKRLDSFTDTAKKSEIDNAFIKYIRTHSRQINNKKYYEMLIHKTPDVIDKAS